MPLEVAPSDEPFDFRRQAAGYARYRRDYSDALYAAIEAETGPAAGRGALDVGCGPGMVAATLCARGWRAVGVDFSAAMLAQAPAALSRVRARGEALPVRDGTAALITCGTSFHWLAPLPALTAFHRALGPSGHVALFWRFQCDGEPTEAVILRAMADVGRALPPGLVAAMQPLAPFAVHAGFVPLAERTLETELVWTREEFVGVVGTIESLRRLAGEHHAAFLARLAARARDELPDTIRERNRERLLVARRA